MNKVIMILGITVSVVLIGLGVYGAVTKEPVKNNPKPEVNEPQKPTTTKMLTCTRITYDDMYEADANETMIYNFKNDELTDMTSTIVLQYPDFETYNAKFGDTQEKKGTISLGGIEMLFELDDVNFTYKLITTASLSELEAGWQASENAPADYSYSSILTYSQNQNYQCQ